jgi:hypothetical protein
MEGDPWNNLNVGDPLQDLSPPADVTAIDLVALITAEIDLVVLPVRQGDNE